MRLLPACCIGRFSYDPATSQLPTTKAPTSELGTSFSDKESSKLPRSSGGHLGEAEQRRAGRISDSGRPGLVAGPTFKPGRVGAKPLAEPMMHSRSPGTAQVCIFTGFCEVWKPVSTRVLDHESLSPFLCISAPGPRHQWNSQGGAEVRGDGHRSAVTGTVEAAAHVLSAGLPWRQPGPGPAAHAAQPLPGLSWAESAQGAGAALPDGVPLSSATSVVLHDSQPGTPPDVMLEGQPSSAQQPVGPRLQLQAPQQSLVLQALQQQYPRSVPLTVLQRTQLPPVASVRLPPAHLLTPGSPSSQRPAASGGLRLASPLPAQFGPSGSYVGLLSAHPSADVAFSAALAAGGPSSGRGLSPVPSGGGGPGLRTSPALRASAGTRSGAGLSVSRSWGGAIAAQGAWPPGSPQRRAL
jgi:hypothetical protein